MIHLRYSDDLEIRERSGDQYISGYAAVFTQDYNMWGNAWERLTPEAFDDLASQVVECRYDHRKECLLGYSDEPDSLTLEVDKKGVWYDQKVIADHPDHRYVLSNIKHKLCKGSSIAFTPTEQSWIKEGDKDINLIHKCTVRDVGPCPKPRYSEANVIARSFGDYEKKEMEELKRSWETWRRVHR